MANEGWALWFAEQANPTPEERRLDRPSEPALMSGYWRINRARTKPDTPMAIWTQDGEAHTIFQFGAHQPKNTSTDEKRWHDFIAKDWLKATAISRDEWDRALQSGKFDDGKDAREFTDEERLDIIPDTPREAGGNAPEGDGDTFHEQVVTKIDAALAKALALPFPITTMEDAQKGAEIIETLTGLGKQGEAKRKIEKQPHIDAAAAVDAKWSPVRSASEMIAKLKTVIETFKRAETARLQKIADEAARVERKRLQDIADAEAEEKRVALQKQLDDEAEQRGEPAEQVVIEAEKVEVVAETVTAPKVSSTYGRAVSTPKTKTATITDVRALCEHFIHAGDADFLEYLGKRANAAARAKITLPGTEIDK